MYLNYNIIEVTKENKKDYLEKIAKLEVLVLNKMEEEGKIGQLFITGENDISSYIHSRNNHVFIAVKNDGSKDVVSAAYITRGQVPFTYNDITKYFKCDNDYQEYVKSKYVNDRLYLERVKDVYIKKICAFRYARDILLANRNVKIADLDEQTRNNKFFDLVKKEYDNPENRFHEKSKIRDSLNNYMTIYMKKNLEDYNDFYWMDFKTIKDIMPRKGGEEIEGLLKYNKYDSTIEAYDKILEYQKFKIYDKSHCKNVRDYYDATPDNTIELDTYITHPDNRGKGLAEIITFEGIKKSLEELGKTKKKVFLASTLHQKNFASKRVSEFFGLEDYIFVNRRNGRDRQVHIFGMTREQIPEYLEKMEKKLAVIHNYNPNGIKLTDKEKNDILKEDSFKRKLIKEEMEKDEMEL